MAISRPKLPITHACSHVFRLLAEVVIYDEDGTRTVAEQYQLCKACGCLQRDVLNRPAPEPPSRYWPAHN